MGAPLSTLRQNPDQAASDRPVGVPVRLARSGAEPSTQANVSLSNLDPRLVEALKCMANKSLDRFTGCMVIHFQDGIALDIETRTKRRLKRP